LALFCFLFLNYQHAINMTTAYSLPRIAYRVAYQILPHFNFQALEKIIEMWTNTPASAGSYYYLMACKMDKLEPVGDDARKFAVASGLLGLFDYYLMEYPVPPPVDISGIDRTTLFQKGAGMVLAPHFSISLRHQQTGEVRFFILGQAPTGGGTTFRSISATGANINLGSGPAPERSLFLERVSQVIAA
jgi:hypothetical protein